MKIRSQLLEMSRGNISFWLKRYLCNVSSFEIRNFKLHMLETCPLTKVTMTKEEAYQYYRQMLTIRWLESAVANLFEQKLIRGFCHLQTGQEASAVGIKAAIRPIDSVITGYRTHGWCYLMGHSVMQIIAELLGKKSGSSKGKGGSMHMYGKNFYGGNGIVAAQVPLGAGIAFASQYMKNEGVSFTIFGDGAAKQGQVFETLNMSKLWKLPCVFVCENNGQSLSLANSSSTTFSTPLAVKTDFYTSTDYIPGIWVDGTDVLTVREASKFAINYCLKNQSPIILELCTPADILLNDPKIHEITNIVTSSRDPTNSFREMIMLADLTTEGELKLIDEDVEKEVDKAVRIAIQDSGPEIQDLTTDAYAHCLEANIRNVIPHGYD